MKTGINNPGFFSRNETRIGSEGFRPKIKQGYGYKGKK